jgi:hypothetical protein
MNLNVYMDDVRTCPYPGWTVTRTVEDTMTLLAAGDVNHLSLDHDMGACAACREAGLDIGNMLTPETTYMHWCQHAMDGTKLVRWMIETGHWSKQKPELHTANPAGRMRMASLIQRYFGQPAQGPMFS